MQTKGFKLALAALFPAMVVAQTQTASTVPQTPPSQEATYITADQVQQVLKYENKYPIRDQTLKDVNIGKLNLSVGIVHRAGPLKPSPDGSESILIHHEQTEVFVIIGGSGTIATGGTIYDLHEIPSTAYMVMTLNGPSASGRVKKGDGVRRAVHPGDVIIIPPDVAHGWEQIDDHVDYLSVRPDPDRALRSGYVNPILNGEPPDQPDSPPSKSADDRGTPPASQIK